jgi:hypothetical protein
MATKPIPVRVGSRLALLAVAVAAQLAAQKMPDAELFARGQAAYLKQQFGEAAMYLFAYLDRNPAAMQGDPAHAQQVVQALNYSSAQTAEALNRRCDTAQAQGGVQSTSRGLSLAPPPLNGPGAPPRPSYSLVCRGGGGLRFAWEQGNMFVVTFERAAQAGGDPRALAPGQCSWRDRPIAANEPDHICNRVDPTNFSISWGADGRTYGISSAAPSYIHSLRSADGFAAFQVYNNGQQCFIVNRVE